MYPYITFLIKFRKDYLVTLCYISHKNITVAGIYILLSKDKNKSLINKNMKLIKYIKITFYYYFFLFCFDLRKPCHNFTLFL